MALTKEPFPDSMPDSVREAVLGGLHPPNVQQLLEEPGYLEREWARFIAHHRKAGTKTRLVEAVFCGWLRNPRTGERAHELLTRRFDAL